MNDKKEIVNVLKKDIICNTNIINFIESYPINRIEIMGDSVLVKGTSDKDWIYISSKSEQELRQLKTKLKRSDTNFAAIEDWMIPILTEGSKVKWIMSTMKLMLPENIILEKPNQKTSVLTQEDAQFLYMNSEYQEVISVDYITDRILHGLNTCIRNEGTPVAWAMTQDDGAIGFLHVLPEYRRKGYARDVMMDIIAKVRQEKKLPFVHIEIENVSSMKLTESLGFQKDRMVNWFELEGKG